MQNHQTTDRKQKASSAATLKASYLKVISFEDRPMNNITSNDISNQDIPSNPRKGAMLEGFISCFYILRKQDNVYKKVCCFLDEYNVKRAYSLIKQAFPKEQIYICDEVAEKQSFCFWEYARKHIKSLKKVNQLTGFSSEGVAA